MEEGVYKIAEQACEIEMELSKNSVGKQDQYIAAFGGIKVLEINRDGKVKVSNANISDDVIRELEENTLLYYTGIKRSATQILNYQNKEISEENIITLDCMHQIKEMAYQTIEYLEAGNLERYGLLLDDYWECKKRMNYKTTNIFIDELYSEAKRNGALGGKIIGAGGGGFLMLYCNHNREQIANIMEKQGLISMKFHFEQCGVQILNL